MRTRRSTVAVGRAGAFGRRVIGGLSASAGISDASQTTSSASKTGPVARTRACSPSAVVTTHDRHAPIPHAMSRSSETWQGTPASAACAATMRCIASGPHAYDDVEALGGEQRARRAPVTNPRSPALPSSVATSTRRATALEDARARRAARRSARPARPSTATPRAASSLGEHARAARRRARRRRAARARRPRARCHPWPSGPTTSIAVARLLLGEAQRAPRRAPGRGARCARPRARWTENGPPQDEVGARCATRRCTNCPGARARRTRGACSVDQADALGEAVVGEHRRRVSSAGVSRCCRSRASSAQCDDSRLRRGGVSKSCSAQHAETVLLRPPRSPARWRQRPAAS